MIDLEGSIERRRRSLEQQLQIPPDAEEAKARVAAKAEGTEIGKLIAFGGVLLCLAAVAVALAALAQGVDFGMVLGLVIGGLLVIGLGLVFFGGSLVSRDAEPAVAKIGQFLIDLVSAVLRREKPSGS